MFTLIHTAGEQTSRIILSVGFMVCENDCCKRQIGRFKQRNQLEAKIYRRRTFCQLAGKCKRLELSRSRYWGIPLPIWRTDDLKEEKIIGSVEELYNELKNQLKQD
jgi:hypothetical protein